MRTLFAVLALIGAMVVPGAVFAQDIEFEDDSGQQGEKKQDEGSAGQAQEQKPQEQLNINTENLPVEQILGGLEYHYPLDGQPAVRRRIKYLPKRLELTPSLGVTFLQDFRHTIVAGVKAEYHFNDYFSVGASGAFKLFSMDSGLTDEMEKTLPSEMNSDTWVDPTPSKAAMKSALDDVGAYANLYVAYTPAFGKMGLFGTYFFNFDVSFMAGVAAVLLQEGDLGPYTDDPQHYSAGKLHMVYEDGYSNGGMRYGPMLGIGMRIYANRWIAFSTEFKWMYISRNDAGFDRTGDPILYDDTNRPWVVVNADDEAWESLMFFHFGASFFLPKWAPRSE